PSRRRHAGQEAQVRRLPERAEPRPHKGRVALGRNPRVEVVARRHYLEAVLLRELAPLQHVVRMELLERRSVTQLAHSVSLLLVRRRVRLIPYGKRFRSCSITRSRPVPVSWPPCHSYPRTIAAGRR